jgi:CheY-like chemotaxis protein
LITNAVKYNKDRGKVFIEVAPAAPDTLRIGVRDEGPGIAEDQIGKLFEPFDRLGAENSTTEGTGIGLTIAKSLVEQMGGKISVDSIIGKGSTFWLEMPKSTKTAEQQPVETEGLRSSAEEDIEGMILYVEDNPANLELVRKIMGLHPGVDFIDAPTGELGLERARAEVPDVILLDINLPGLDGFEVLDKLRVMPETRHIPVIALTAAATEADIERGQAAGFFSYLTKPIAARELISTVRRALRLCGWLRTMLLIPCRRGGEAKSSSSTICRSTLPLRSGSSPS